MYACCIIFWSYRLKIMSNEINTLFKCSENKSLRKKNNMCNQNTIALIDHNTKSTLIVYKEDILFKLIVTQLQLKILFFSINK